MDKLNFTNLKENRKHGDYIMPFSLYKGTINENFSYVPMHWHEELEIIFISSGTCDYKIDLSSFIVNKGDLLIVGSQKLHSLSLIPNKNMEWVSFVFNMNMLKSLDSDGTLLKYIAPILNGNHELPIKINKDNIGYSNLLSTFENIIECYSKKELAYELELKSLLFYFFALLYKNNLITNHENKNILTSKTTDKIKSVLNYINDHYYENISISTLANLCDYSEYHFMRFFKKHMGLTCIQYINNYRLEKATHLLTSSNDSIMNISLEVGFDNLSYFNKLFKKKYNITPKEFRLKNKL